MFVEGMPSTNMQAIELAITCLISHSRCSLRSLSTDQGEVPLFVSQAAAGCMRQQLMEHKTSSDVARARRSDRA
jgi:hypothetical protein